MGKRYNSTVIFGLLGFVLIQAFEGENVSPIVSRAPNQGLQNSAGLFQAMLKQNLATLQQGFPNRPGALKQQYTGVPAELEEFLKLQKGSSDTYYEPFWTEGEWVFQRPTFTAKSPRYLEYYKNLEQNILEECTEFCPRMYESYGPVCAHFFSMQNGLYKIRQFQNLCHMEFENCVQARKPWKPMFQGNCNYRWKKMAPNEGGVVWNTNRYLKDV